MPAVSLLVNVNLLGDRVGAELSQGSQSRPTAWVHFHDFGLHGTDPVAYRCLAARCLTAAGLLEQDDASQIERGKK